MKQLLSTVQELKTQARINHETLTEMGHKISYMQCLQLVAKSHGYKSWEVIQTKALKDELVISIQSADEIELKTELSNSLWIKIGNISVSLRDSPDNINVSFYNVGSEDTDGIDFYADKEELKSLDNEGFDEDLYYEEKLAQTYLIKEEYYESNKSKKDLSNAIERLVGECREHYSSKESATEFLLEPFSLYQIKVYHTKEDFDNRNSEYVGENYDMGIAIREAKLLENTTTIYKVVVVERSDVDSGSYVYENPAPNKPKFK